MKCKFCQAENPEGAKVCESCGKLLEAFRDAQGAKQGEQGTVEKEKQPMKDAKVTNAEPAAGSAPEEPKKTEKTEAGDKTENKQGEKAAPANKTENKQADKAEGKPKSPSGQRPPASQAKTPYVAKAQQAAPKAADAAPAAKKAEEKRGDGPAKAEPPIRPAAEKAAEQEDRKAEKTGAPIEQEDLLNPYFASAKEPKFEDRLQPEKRKAVPVVKKGGFFQNKRNVAILVAALVVVVGAGTFITFRSINYNKEPGSPTAVDSAGNPIANVSGGNVGATKDGDHIFSTEGETDNTLVVTDKDGNKKTITDSFADYRISPTGHDALIMENTDTDPSGNLVIGSLSYYDTDKGESVKIADNVVSYSYQYSPDGKSVVYSTYQNNKMDLFYRKTLSGESVAVDSSAYAITAISIANEGKLIIYDKTENNKQTICSFDNGKKEDLGSFAITITAEDSDNSRGVESVYLNASGSEALVLYQGSGEGSNFLYMKKAGSAKADIINAPVVGYTPPMSPKDKMPYTAKSRTGTATYLNQDSLGTVFYKAQADMNLNLYAYTSGGQKETVAEAAEMYYSVASDNKTLIYLAGNQINKVTVGSDGKYKSETIGGSDVTDFKMSIDGSKVYVTNLEGKLQLIEGGKAGDALADNVTGLLACDDKGNSALYYTDYDGTTGKGTLCMKTIGKDAVTLSKNARFIQVNADGGTVTYYTNFSQTDSGLVADLYAFRNGKSEKLASNTKVN